MMKSDGLHREWSSFSGHLLRAGLTARQRDTGGKEASGVPGHQKGKMTREGTLLLSSGLRVNDGVSGFYCLVPQFARLSGEVTAFTSKLILKR